jgi:hypothetical protein
MSITTPRIDLRPFGIPSILRELTLIRVLEEYEGPILSEYKATTGGLYVEAWCDTDGTFNRFLLVRTEQRAIAEYMGGRISMLQLFNEYSDGGGFLLDKLEGKIVASHSVRFSELPSEYLPKPEARHDEELRPSWVTVPQNFLIEENWDAVLLGKIETDYQNVAGFAYFTMMGKQRKLPTTVFDYEYNGGYVVGTLFRKIRDSIPQDNKAKSVGVNAASPGVLTLDAPREIVKQLSKTIKALESSRLAYDQLHNWSKLDPKKIDGLPKTAFEDLETLCRSLSISIDSLFRDETKKRQKQAILTSGKLVAAYYRRLWKVIEPEDRAEFISVPKPSPVLAPEQEEDDEE